MIGSAVSSEKPSLHATAELMTPVGHGHGQLQYLENSYGVVKRVHVKVRMGGGHQTMRSLNKVVAMSFGSGAILPF